MGDPESYRDSGFVIVAEEPRMYGGTPVANAANAALIANAPELLAALREMLAISLRVDDLAWADAVGEDKGIGPCDKARQAIAKAEGV